MDNKDFSAQVMGVIKNNLSEIRKNLLNLDDYVAKKDYDELQQKYDAAQFSLEMFQQQKTQLETTLADKSEKVSALSKEISMLYDKIETIGSELRQVEKQNLALKNSLETSQQQNAQLKSALTDKAEKVSVLAKEISTMYVTLESTDSELRQVEKQNLTLQSSLEKVLPLVEEQTAILEVYVKNYSELENIYAAYKKLSGNTKFALEGIFGAENSPTSFLAGVLQEGHLESLFDYVATSINNGAPSNEIEILCGLFEFAFDAANSGRREKIYARLKISEGDNFDNGEMRKTSNSEQSGKVKEILLVGYKYSRTDKVIRQSLVVIG